MHTYIRTPPPGQLGYFSIDSTVKHEFSNSPQISDLRWYLMAKFFWKWLHPKTPKDPTRLLLPRRHGAFLIHRVVVLCGRICKAQAVLKLNAYETYRRHAAICQRSTQLGYFSIDGMLQKIARPQLGYFLTDRMLWNGMADWARPRLKLSAASQTLQMDVWQMVCGA